jgi:hypothetical protein
MTIGQLLKHDFKSKNNLSLYDSNGNLIYCEYSYGYWYKQEYDDKGNIIYYDNSDGNWFKRDYDVNDNERYYENSDGHWWKREFDSNGKVIYYEDSNGAIIDNRPKGSCNGKVVEIEGKRYQLNEIG